MGCPSGIAADHQRTFVVELELWVLQGGSPSHVLKRETLAHLGTRDTSTRREFISEFTLQPQ
ncbi:hypothetical protein Acr_12g0008590 [Actinidia rufa]|uniref:Uncharacterized protein n=1 Tax=Actinidia rufa TaxID=165716 RepID=A0A7J0FHZ2_9ERIC|nr:hypothetical protein Acr_12g0008590 [Actinidia rufa]